jgi:hypothetical protein
MTTRKHPPRMAACYLVHTYLCMYVHAYVDAVARSLYDESVHRTRNEIGCRFITAGFIEDVLVFD